VSFVHLMHGYNIYYLHLQFIVTFAVLYFLQLFVTIQSLSKATIFPRFEEKLHIN